MGLQAMFVRSAVAILSIVGVAFAMSPSLAQSVDPATVLAAKGHPKHGQGFANRTARISSIMGADLSTAAPLRIPNNPLRTRPGHREADASAGLR